MQEIDEIRTIEELPDNILVKVTTAGNTVNIKHVSSKNRKINTIKLSKDEYLVVGTGEIKSSAHSENRGQNINGLRKTISRLRDLINANVSTSENLLWITLTYRENMTDSRRLMVDSKNYHARLNRYFIKKGIEVPNYIDVVEPQERGAWHIHALLIWNEKAPFIPNSKIQELWTNGFTKTKKIPSECDNIGAYLTPYLTDIELDMTTAKTSDLSEFNVIDREIDVNGQKTAKKYIKGGRLYLYPPGMNLYRHSKGVKQPVIEEMSCKEAKEKVLGATKTFENVITLNDGTFQSTIINSYYNTKRK